MTTELNNLIQRIEKLDINQQRIIGELVEELVGKKKRERETSSVGGRSATPQRELVRQRDRFPNHNFISKNGVPLEVGDKVEITTSRKVGRDGDVAKVDKFNQKYVAITILHSGKPTQRASKYLNFLE